MSDPPTNRLTPEAKSLLSTTIRALRARVIDDLTERARGDYRLGVKAAQANLPEARRKKRTLLEGWIDERVRAAAVTGKDKAKTKETADEARARFLHEAVKLAAATWLNRVVLLRHLEALGLSKPLVITGGWESRGYRQFREFAPALLLGERPDERDETEGYAQLLQLVFDELAVDLPGLFGDVGLLHLFPMPASTLRELVEQLDRPELASAWTDDTTLGWVYQYWNDPEREALDAKIAGGGKIEPHEIASKTQMFTERYMVEWLLHNSLGAQWLCICKQNGWRSDAEDVLPGLDARRAAWRAKREAGEVALDALMPIEPGLEERWKYYVPQPIPAEMVAAVPGSIRDLKLLDPACGSGHFLIIAFDLLVAMYCEEARHRGESWSDRDIAESILEKNLHGIDLDPRAVQIAAAGLLLKARQLARDARPRALHLVAPALQLAQLPAGDPALDALRRGVLLETGIPGALTDRVVSALAGVDHLGTLLKVDAAVEEAIRSTELTFEKAHGQGNIFTGFPAQQVTLSIGEAKATVLDKLETFLGQHSNADDLGLRLDGEQLASGVRFVRLAREGEYDLVIGNPPYQGATKMADASYVAAKYPLGKADLYAAFLQRGLELVKPGGISAMVTMRGWMFLGQFTGIREWLLRENDLRTIGDVGWGAFQDMTDNPVAMAVTRRGSLAASSTAICPTSPTTRVRTDENYRQIIAGLRSQVGRYEFDVRGFTAIEGEPIVYWWSEAFLASYAAAPKLGATHTVRYGLSTQNNTRWLRRPWEVRCGDVMLKSFDDESQGWDGHPWVTYIKGSEGRAWCDEVGDVLLWRARGLELATYPDNRFGRGATWYYRRGVAFANIGSSFSARAHSRPSVFGHVAGSVFAENTAAMVCLLNSSLARFTMESINPGIHFLTTDVERLALLRIEGDEQIFAVVEAAFVEHESAREASVEFLRPGPSPWRYAQAWAQLAVDRPAGAPLPPYEPVLDPPRPMDHVSFAVGVALGRFGAAREGILDVAPATALPHGILFLSAAVDSEEATAARKDSLAHPACAPLRAAWATHGRAIDAKSSLRDYLRDGFFKHHKDAYENRPIYFPLSSSKRSFVAWVSIHRWGNALTTLLADHLIPERRALDGQIERVRQARASPDKGQKAKAEKEFDRLQKLSEELDDFLGKVAQCAEKGPPPPDGQTKPREVDAPHAMDLDDGVMVNAAALWPLLEPQWKDPKKWWKELANAAGKKDYDWAHLAKRYFPARVEGKCRLDPSLGVAHGCFWALHPAKAWQWELRLQDEIRAGFTIDEPGSDEARARYLAEHAAEAEALRGKELLRRAKKAAKAGREEEDEQLGLGLSDELDPGAGDADA